MPKLDHISVAESAKNRTDGTRFAQPNVPVNEQLEVMPPTGPVDSVYTPRILNVPNQGLKLWGRIVGEAGERGLLPEPSQQIWLL